MPLLGRLMAGALMLAIGGSVITASAASVTTPGSSAGTFNAPITADDLKPPECAGITLTHVQAGSGVIIGIGIRNELITGSAGVDTINGMQGDDCILGGGSDDDITGGQQTDVCNGGGDAGDTFTTCETVIP